jgi:hypothetical protein
VARPKIFDFNRHICVNNFVSCYGETFRCWSLEICRYLDAYLPLKMGITIWRMFQNKIPLKDDLLKRGVLIKLQTNCAYGCRVTEIASHIFFECS